MEINKIINTDALSGLKSLPDRSINCYISSPPYWALRSYLTEENPSKHLELGQEPTFKQYIDNLIIIFKEVYRVLKDDGCCFVNLGDSFYGTNRNRGIQDTIGSKQAGNTAARTKIPNCRTDETLKKSLCNIPYRFAIKMVDELNWIQRNLIIWHKPNKFPESCKDRFTVDFEPIFFFTKNQKYNFQQQFEPFSPNSKPLEIYTGQSQKDYDEVGAQNPSDSKRRILESMKKNGGRNKRSVWSINVKPTKFKHTATYPLELIDILIKAGCPEGGIVCDSFGGIGTTAISAQNLKRNYILFELNNDYCKIALERLSNI